jgi:hypothetical protein
MFQTFLTSHPRRLLESARHGFYRGMMEDVLNDESESISLSQLLDLPTPATFFLLHCDEWDRVVALPRHKFVTGATLLQLVYIDTKVEIKTLVTHSRLNRQIWYRHPNSEAEMTKFKIFRDMDFYFVGITF